MSHSTLLKSVWHHPKSSWLFSKLTQRPEIDRKATRQVDWQVTLSPGQELENPDIKPQTQEERKRKWFCKHMPWQPHKARRLGREFFLHLLEEISIFPWTAAYSEFRVHRLLLLLWNLSTEVNWTVSYQKATHNSSTTEPLAHILRPSPKKKTLKEYRRHSEDVAQVIR